MRSAERNISDYKVIKERQYDVGAVQMRVAGILHRAVFFMKGDCSIVRAPVIAASKHALLMSAVRDFHSNKGDTWQGKTVRYSCILRKSSLY